MYKSIPYFERKNPELEYKSTMFTLPKSWQKQKRIHWSWKGRSNNLSKMIQNQNTNKYIYRRKHNQIINSIFIKIQFIFKKFLISILCETLWTLQLSVFMSSIPLYIYSLGFIDVNFVLNTFITICKQCIVLYASGSLLVQYFF